MPFAEDLTPCFAGSDFGTAATYSVDSATVNGIFDAAYTDPLGLVEGVGPVFICRTSDVSTAAHGQTLLINAVTYTVCGVEPDGTGVTLLRLTQ
jgi:hypothetical protein